MLGIVLPVIPAASRQLRWPVVDVDVVAIYVIDGCPVVVADVIVIAVDDDRSVAPPPAVPQYGCNLLAGELLLSCVAAVSRTSLFEGHGPAVFIHA